MGPELKQYRRVTFGLVFDGAAKIAPKRALKYMSLRLGTYCKSEKLPFPGPKPKSSFLLHSPFFGLRTLRGWQIPQEAKDPFPPPF